MYDGTFAKHHHYYGTESLWCPRQPAVIHARHFQIYVKQFHIPVYRSTSLATEAYLYPALYIIHEDGQCSVGPKIPGVKFRLG